MVAHLLGKSDWVYVIGEGTLMHMLFWADFHPKSKRTSQGYFKLSGEKGMRRFRHGADRGGFEGSMPS
jgi:hypothetical protein